MNISKTTFQFFLCCPKNTWLKLHKPELADSFVVSEFDKHLMEQGNEVESYARNLFPEGIEVTSTGKDACNDTVRLMATKVPTIFQATFISDGFIARNDALSFDESNNCWNLFEVKGTNSLKENSQERDHITDVAFQVAVLNQCGVNLGRFFIIHLNKEYIRHGELDYKSLFAIEDVTDKVQDKLSEVEGKMAAAKEYLLSEKEPAGSCDCMSKGRGRHCSTFKYSNPHIPDYSIHDISRISKVKIENFIDQGIYDLNDIPVEFLGLSEKQLNQVLVHKLQKPVIDRVKIKEELDTLRFPLYFLDYEAVGPAIPVFNSFSPYKRIPFQVSLHILEDPSKEPSHIEYLHTELTDPTQNVAETLQRYISPGGTVIAWHKSYEAGINREIGERLPDYAGFFEMVNNCLYDLKDVFHNQHYIHHDFHGSVSLKKVLPALAPELRYDILNIQDGGQAVDAWWKMVSPTCSNEDKEEVSKQLKLYCGQDTYAMYVIWKHLYDIVYKEIIVN